MPNKYGALKEMIEATLERNGPSLLLEELIPAVNGNERANDKRLLAVVAREVTLGSLKIAPYYDQGKMDLLVADSDYEGQPLAPRSGQTITWQKSGQPIPRELIARLET